MNTYTVYMVCNLTTGELLQPGSATTFSPSAFEALRFSSLEAAKKARTKARSALPGEVDSNTIDVVKARLDIRYARRGRPSKIA